VYIASPPTTALVGEVAFYSEKSRRNWHHPAPVLSFQSSAKGICDIMKIRSRGSKCESAERNYQEGLGHV